MVSAGMDLATTALGFGIGATFIVYVCTRLICGRSSASSHDSASPASATFDLEPRDVVVDRRRQIAIQGLEPAVVAALPTVKYNRESLGGCEDMQCSICLEQYGEEEILRVMPACGHDFHRACIDTWLRRQPTCPVCRLRLHVDASFVDLEEAAAGRRRPAALGR